MYYIFVNPASKSGKGANLWSQAEQILKNRNVSYEIRYTKPNTSIREDYVEILNSTSERPIRLIILGGDGTLNQVIEGITAPEETELSLIRSGSGNDFSRNKSLPEDLPSILDGILSHKHEMMIDIGKVTYSDGSDSDGNPIPDNEHRFLVSAGLGYDADICYNANHSPKLKKILRHQIYTYFGVKNIFDTPLANLEVEIDGQLSFYPHVYFLAAMNQPCEGGGVPMTPDAVDTDGKLDCCIIYGLTRFKALLTIPKLKAKKHIGLPGVGIFRSKKITVSASEPKMVHYDGETPGLYKNFVAEICNQIKFVY